MPSHSHWYTSTDTLAEVRQVFGGPIDLDPCSSVKANQRVQAKHIYTIEDSCLNRDWQKVTSCFMNHPYSSDCGGSDPFIEEFLKNWRNERFENGIVLANSNTGSRWYQLLVENCTMFCLQQGREKFTEDILAVLRHQRHWAREDLEAAYKKLDKAEEGGLLLGSGPRYDNTFFLCSEDKACQERFFHVFSQRGVVARPMEV